VIHWPAAFAPGASLEPPHPTIPNEIELDETVSLVDTWKAMIALPKSKVRAIGVSNFGINAMEGITKATGVAPVSQILSIYASILMRNQVVNQIEAHPLLPQPELVNYCNENNIHITAYSPLGHNCASLCFVLPSPSLMTH